MCNTNIFIRGIIKLIIKTFHLHVNRCLYGHLACKEQTLMTIENMTVVMAWLLQMIKLTLLIRELLATKLSQQNK